MMDESIMRKHNDDDDDDDDDERLKISTNPLFLLKEKDRKEK